MEPEERLNFFTSGAPALLRLGTAAFVAEGVETFPRPAKMIELYEFQGCPFCRKVHLAGGAATRLPPALPESIAATTLHACSLSASVLPGSLR